MKIEVNQRTFYGLFVVFGLLIVGITYYAISLDESKIGANDHESLQVRFNLLSTAKSSLCSGPQFIDDMQQEERLQGSCCGPMDFHRYQEQVEGLKKYSHISKIPSDPYDIPVSLVNELLDYQKTLLLNSEQQIVYDEATKKSHEHGPCCCKCWRWYAFEGLAKYLIIEYDFTAEEIAEVWDLEDGCGGTGHNHG
jgi:hypothetical protein